MQGERTRAACDRCSAEAIMQSAWGNACDLSLRPAAEIAPIARGIRETIEYLERALERAGETQ